MQDNIKKSTEDWEQLWRSEKIDEAPISSNLLSYQKPVLRILEKIIKENGFKDILSAGCGQDIICFNLQQDFAGNLNITLLDISREVLDWNKKLFGLSKISANYIEGDIFSMPFADETFDLVFNTGVLEHFSEHEQISMTREIARVLKPGGVFVTANPSARGWIYKIGMGQAKKKGIWRFGEEEPVRSLSFLKEEIDGISSIQEIHRDFITQLNFLSYVSKWLKFASFPIRYLGRNEFVQNVFDVLFGWALGTYLIISIIKKK